MNRFAQMITDGIVDTLESIEGIEPFAIELEIPHDPSLGDFGFPCFRFAKHLKKAPPQIAKDFCEKLKINRRILSSKIEVSCVGTYVNFKVPGKIALKAILSDVLQGPKNGAYGKEIENSLGVWVMEYSSPNIAKPFNIYHLRGTALGAALNRIAKYRGYNTISINHYGDWGTQYGKLAVAVKMFGQSLPEKPTIPDLVNIYVKFHEEAEKNPELENLAREAFKKLENHDPEITSFWKKSVEIALQEFERTYDRLGIQFDHYWGESFYQDKIPAFLEELKKRSLLEESEGAQVVFIQDEKGNELPPCIVIKSDGATIYATRDLTAANYRFEQFKFDRMSYIVGGEQKLHFQQIFAVLKKMGLPWADRCEYIPTGLYRFKDQKMSTRKGNYITLESVFDQAIERATSILNEREESYTDQEINDITQAVGVGAVVFHDIKTDPAKDVEFDLDTVVSFSGETGPYLQYAHSRCLSILQKAKLSGEFQDLEVTSNRLDPLSHDEEIALVKLLGQFPTQLDRVLSHSKASHLATYLLDVAKAFSTFYRNCHVLGESKELTEGRLLIVESARRVLAQGLVLLGIPLPPKM